jgi:hypothetical protein
MYLARRRRVHGVELGRVLAGVGHGVAPDESARVLVRAAAGEVDARDVEPR